MRFVRTNLGEVAIVLSSVSFTYLMLSFRVGSWNLEVVVKALFCVNMQLLLVDSFNVFDCGLFCSLWLVLLFGCVDIVLLICLYRTLAVRVF